MIKIYDYDKISIDDVFERLIEETTADTLHFIPDTYWMQVGGVNPAEYMKKLKAYIKEKIPQVKEVELLPYHLMGLHKYKKKNLEIVMISRLSVGCGDRT